MTKQHLTRLETDSMRGLAILMIMSYNYIRHIIGIDGNEMKYSAESTARFISEFFYPTVFLGFTGWVGVCVFVFLCGYCLTLKYMKSQDSLSGKAIWLFYKDHFIKVSVLFIPMLIISNLLMWAVKGEFEFEIPGPYWFFPLILQCYALYPLLVRANQKILLIVIALGVIYNGINMHFLPIGLGADIRHHLPCWIAPLAMGIFMARTGVNKSLKIIIPATLLTGVSFVIRPLMPLTDLLVVFVFIGICTRLKCNLLLWIGAISSGIFLVHPIIRQILYHIMDCENMVLTSTVIYFSLVIPYAFLHNKILRKLSK